MKLLLLFSALFICASSFGQQKCIVYLNDKPNASYVEFSQRAEIRRSKNNVSLSERDKEVSQEYLTELAKFGKVKSTSRWLNAVVLEGEFIDDKLLAKIPFVKRVEVCEEHKVLKRKDIFEYSVPKSLNYGNADTQVRQIGADCLHDLGYTGTGVYLAIIDAGFQGMDTISFFDSLYNSGRVLDTHDFINGTSVYDYSLHGTAVGSCIFGYKASGPVLFAGTGIGVDVALYVSEDVGSETPIEEFNLVAALERCDVQGVEIANISLGYVDFDDPMDNHAYADMNGQTTIAAQGVNIAASVGIVVVAAAGNSGPSFISTPCDADSCLCIAAVDNEGNFAPFSSVGPASDGAIKPDVAATGWDTWVVLNDGSLVMGSGTSFASPTMAGAVACLIDAQPSATAIDIIEAVRKSGNQYNFPDEFLGYGIPDMCVANDTLIEQFAGVAEQGNGISIFPNPVADWIHVELNGSAAKEAEILDINGKRISLISLENITSIDVSALNSGVYFISIQELNFKEKFIVRR